ncbi:hypothetical protein RWV98_14300 [Agathobaculum sp. NTUH-O15-33]|uniref:hypothetical protein n=1 Tax=Agathobaculum sp. NTUH-O15-33 TaxID=3079302 RepID=UPI002958B602|nr:hypothetical protein [Agathobaculum sp. NTUH-O15-33]WNX83752.1 hypothetical protein RWV98_14300 [Agathobaculum sp. NTUH-O15-33]
MKLSLRWNFITLAALDVAALLFWAAGWEAGIVLGVSAVAILIEMFWSVHNAMNDLKRNVPNEEYQKLAARGIFTGIMLGKLWFMAPVMLKMSDTARRIYHVWRWFGLAAAGSLLLLSSAYGWLGDILSFT